MLYSCKNDSILRIDITLHHITVPYHWRCQHSICTNADLKSVKTIFETFFQYQFLWNVQFQLFPTCLFNIAYEVRVETYSPGNTWMSDFRWHAAGFQESSSRIQAERITFFIAAIIQITDQQRINRHVSTKWLFYNC